MYTTIERCLAVVAALSYTASATNLGNEDISDIANSIELLNAQIASTGASRLDAEVLADAEFELKDLRDSLQECIDLKKDHKTLQGDHSDLEDEHATLTTNHGNLQTADANKQTAIDAHLKNEKRLEEEIRKLESEKIPIADISGVYSWKHNGKDRNGDLILHADGTASTTTAGWTGGPWFQQTDGTFSVFMNTRAHIFAATPDKKNLVLLEETGNPQFRSPPTVMTLDHQILPLNLENTRVQTNRQGTPTHEASLLLSPGGTYVVLSGQAWGQYDWYGETKHITGFRFVAGAENTRPRDPDRILVRYARKYGENDFREEDVDVNLPTFTFASEDVIIDLPDVEILWIRFYFYNNDIMAITQVELLGPAGQF